MKTITAAGLAAATLCLTGSTPRQAELYELDTAHTNIGFVVRHLAVTNVRGKFNRFDGRIQLDTADITRSSVRVVIEAASIDTENERRDNHLRSDDFLNVEQYPTITFVSTRVERAGDQLSVTGDLTIRDVTREVVIPFELSGPVGIGGRRRIGAEGALTINRFEYGLKYNRFTEAIAVVAPEVRIELSVEAVTPREPID